VRNPANGRVVVVRVNDRGPFHSDRVIDLSYTAALKLGLLGGVAPVEVERITYEAIRTGAWRQPAPAETPGNAAAPVLLADAAPGQRPPPAAAAVAAAAADDPIAEIAWRSAAVPVPPPERGAAAAVDIAAPAAPAPLPPETAAPARAAALAAPGFWLQLGAFSQRDGAVDFQQRVAREAGWLAPLMAIFDERSLHRLQAGPYASRSDAQGAAERVRESLQLVPAIVERR
jgi:rare lipoprotein A